MKCEKGCQDGFISPGFRSKETTQRVFQRRLGTRQNYKKGQVSFQPFSAHQSPEHSHAHFPHMAFTLWEPNIPIGLSGASQLLSTGQFVIDAYHGPRTLPRVEFETHCCKSSPAVIFCCPIPTPMARSFERLTYTHKARRLSCCLSESLGFSISHSSST